MMTREEFDARKAHLEELYGSTARDAGGRRAQALARLYAESEWTQEALAEKEQMQRRRIAYLLIYGKFLLGTNSSKAAGCSEWNFRVLWNRTDKTMPHHERFAAVDTMLEEEEAPMRPELKGLGKKLVAQFTDGKYHRAKDIANALDVPMEAVRGICDRIVSQGAFQTFGERRPAPPKDGSYAYRFVKGGKKKIDVAVLSSEVQPVLDDMQMIISGPRKSDFTREAMQTAFSQLLKVLDSIAR